MEKKWITGEQGMSCLSALWYAFPSENKKSTIELLSIHTFLQLLQVDGIRTLSWIDDPLRPENFPGRYTRFTHMTFRYVGHKFEQPQFIVYGRIPASKHQSRSGDKNFKTFSYGTRGSGTNDDNSMSELGFDVAYGLIALAHLQGVMPDSFTQVLQNEAYGKKLLGSSSSHDFKCEEKYNNCAVFIYKNKIDTLKDPNDECSLASYRPLNKKIVERALNKAGTLAGFNERINTGII